MLFSSVTFLFFFLPTVLTLYFLPSSRWRNYFFLAASIFFYAWSEGAHVLILLVSIFCNYLFGLWLNAAQAAEGGLGAERSLAEGGSSYFKTRKFALVSGLLFNLALLAVFKYTNFFTANLSALLHPLGLAPISATSIHVPLGISFFTFHAISYLIDVYRNDAPVQKNPGFFAVYMAAFPKILAGPIAFYRNTAAQLPERVVSAGLLLSGIERFITGLAKKVLIANPLAGVADAAFALPAASLDPFSAWAGIICYTLQIYFDFSGYSDMAIGLGKMFGFDLPENFNFPYIAQSVREFWRRWHISLSTWFRDYLYIPLGGNRRGHLRNYFNLVVVFVLCGLWHGASWNFVVWGGWYGLFLVFERTRFGDFIHSAWRPVRHLYLILVVVIGWVFFRAETLSFAVTFIGAMFGLHGMGSTPPHFTVLLTGEMILIAAFAAVFSLPISVRLRRPGLPKPDSGHSLSAASVCFSSVYAALIGFLFLLSCMSLAGGTHKAFIYFKF